MRNKAHTNDPDPLSAHELDDIQAGPVAAIPTKKKIFFFFQIASKDTFRQAFKANILSLITTSNAARNIRAQVKQHKLERRADLHCFAAVNVAFSYEGLQKALCDENIDDLGDEPFIKGQFARAESELNDDTSTWLCEYKKPIDGVFIITGSDQKQVNDTIGKLEEDLGNSITKVYRRDCSVRESPVGPYDLKDFNHFGWRDGFTELFVRYYDDGDVQRFPGPGQPIVPNPGVLIVRGDDRPKWAINGSLLAFRHFHLLVPEFDNYLNSIATQLILKSPILSPNSTDTDSEIRKCAELIGARFNGRWKSGAPLVLAPGEDDMALGRDPDRRNNFRDYPRNQSYCPFAAHTRKTGPRSDLPDDLDEHAIVRAGLHYGKELTEYEKTEHKTVEDRGLAFACYQSSLVNGFEFMQKRCNSLIDPIRGTSESGLDPMIGQGDRRMTGYDVEDLEKELTGIPLFSIVYGGGYFFLPSLSTLEQIK